MNKQELQGAFSKIHASDALMKEVLSVEKEKRTVSFGWKHAVRLTAMVAVAAILVGVMAFWPGSSDPEKPGIIAVSGVMKAYACDLDSVEKEELSKYELTDTIDSYKRTLVPYTDVMGEAIPFTFRIPDDYYGKAEISFCVSMDYGMIYEENKIDTDPKSELTVYNGDTIRWMHGSMREAIDEIGHCGRFFANILIMADERIVGYGIIDFVFYNEEGMMPSFVTIGFSTVCFPMVDGEFQNVSEEYVWKQIEEYKRTKPEPEVIPMG